MMTSFILLNGITYTYQKINPCDLNYNKIKLIINFILLKTRIQMYIIEKLYNILEKLYMKRIDFPFY